MSYFCTMNTFSKILTDWYAIHKRTLPWRETADPYKIWISEIILQQTRVKQGFEYYMRFIRRFPDVKALAAATEDEVMKYWQGLGYYSRARHLHQAARSMKGMFPQTYDDVRALKGVGDYTAAAICSMAYAMPYAVVDGNVYRVLARYFGIDTPIDSTKGKKLFATLAQELLDKHRPGIYNQAIMDFGALVCTPQQPQCDGCPLSDRCLARSKGMTGQWPVKQHKTKTTDRYFTYLYIRRAGETCLHKRTQKDIWKNLFELPLIESTERLTTEQLAVHPTLQAWWADTQPPQPHPVILGIKHVLSHQIIHADFYTLFLPKDSLSFSSFLWTKEEDIHRYAVSKLIQEFLEKHVGIKP